MSLPRNPPGYKIGKAKTTSSPVTASKQCRYCDRKFSKVEHLKRHERSHTGERPYTCPQCQKSFSRSDVLIRHLKNHPRLPDQEIRNERAERDVDTKANQLLQVTPQNFMSAESAIATFVPKASTEYSCSQTKPNDNLQSSVPLNESNTLNPQVKCGLDHLATLASRQDYGCCVMDPMLPTESHQALQEISYDDSANTDQSYNWNQDQAGIQHSLQIDPNLDPRLTQPEKFLPVPLSDQENSEVTVKYKCN